MDFAFSEEQEMLRDQARRFMVEQFSADTVVALVEWANSADRPEPEIAERMRWDEIVGLGWVGLSIPEADGGAGMSFLDEAVLLEELGYAMYPGPYLSTSLALPALIHEPAGLKRVLAGEMRATLSSNDLRSAPSGLTATEDGSGVWKLHGTKTLLPDLWDNLFVVTLAHTDAGEAWFSMDVGGEFEGAVSRQPTMDSTRLLGELRGAPEKGTPARMLTEPGPATVALSEALRARAHATIALEAVGVAQKALDLAMVHTKERQQFGKPIGSYQAVSHQVADTYVDVELARSITYWAAWCVSQGDPEALTAAAAAKAFATEAAVLACERSIQVHGGIGFTWEHILHRYYKRAQWLESFAGYPQEQRETVAAALLDGSEKP